MSSRLATSGGLSLRGVAAGFVVVQHTLVTLLQPESVREIYTGGLGWSQRLGLFGVDLFFALSGFLLVHELRPERLNHHRRIVLETYFVRRVARILPAVLVVGVVMAGIRCFRGEPALGPFVHLVTFSQNYVSGELALLPQAWTLDLEWVFYLALPLVALLISRLNSPRSRMLTLAGIGFAAWLLSPSLGALTGPLALRIQQWLGPSTFLIVFLGGSVIRQREWELSVWARRRLGGVCVIAVGVLVAEAGIQYEHQKLWHLQAAVVCAAVLVLNPDFGRIAAWLGERSFTLYLIHLPVLSYLVLWDPLSRPQSLTVALLVAPLVLLVTAVIAAVGYHIVERPFITRARDWSRQMHASVKEPRQQ